MGTKWAEHNLGPCWPEAVGVARAHKLPDIDASPSWQQLAAAPTPCSPGNLNRRRHMGDRPGACLCPSELIGAALRCGEALANGGLHGGELMKRPIAPPGGGAANAAGELGAAHRAQSVDGCR